MEIQQSFKIIQTLASLSTCGHSGKFRYYSPKQAEETWRRHLRVVRGGDPVVSQRLSHVLVHLVAVGIPQAVERREQVVFELKHQQQLVS